MLSRKKLKDKSPEEIRKMLDDAFLNIYVDDKDIWNPLDWPPECSENPHMYISWIMSKPEYFYFICSEILNIEILPYQGVILKEIWNKRFPMLIGSRGMSKAISPDELVRIFNGWKKIKDIKVGDKVYGSDGKLCNVLSTTEVQKDLNFYKITLRDGRTIDCCEDHQWKVWRKSKNDWFVLKTKDMIEIKDTYSIPINKIIDENEDVELPVSPYEFGILIAKESQEEKKFIPEQYKFASSNQKLDLLKGLLFQNNIFEHGTIKYTTQSQKLSNDFLDIARSLGFACRKIHSKNTNDITILLNRNDKVAIDKIEYIGKRDGVCISVDSYDKTYITKDYIVTHNSFLMSIYSLLRALLIPKRKILIAGAAFRQSKVIFNYCETIYNNSPLLRDICSAYGSAQGPHHNPDMFYFNIGSSRITAVPVGPGGDKIRGQRAHDLFSDEFGSLPKEIFETVMVGFTAVSSDPIKNVKEKARLKLVQKLKDLGIEIEDDSSEDEKYVSPNQVVITGTAGYTFEHFYEYWQDWHDIIASKGNPHALERYLSKKRQSSDMNVDDILANLNYKDYSIMRIPFEVIPDGFMDKEQVMRSKATMHLSTYLCEYSAVFPDDSQGFFKRSLINKSTCGPGKNISHEGYKDINFSAMLKGDPSKQYIMGIDPASDSDNFAVVILEVYKNHRRVVYGWTTNKQQQKYEIEKGFTQEYDYYAYCILKIRQLMKRFNIIRIILDIEGGGRSIREGLMNERLIGDGEQRIFEIVEDGVDKDTDMLDGLHILEMAKFSTATWLSEANNGLRFDLERKILLFPYFDTIALSIAEGSDLINERIYDTLEFCMEEIEQTKNELTTITLTKTATNRDRWDTPDAKLPGGKKGKQRKDRYSALLIANMCARQLMNDLTFYPEPSLGGFAERSEKSDGKLFSGNEEFNKYAQSFYDYL